MQENTDTGGVKNIKSYAYIIIALVIVVVDEIVKHKVLMTLPKEGELSSFSILSFAIHKNLGIAFDIPFARPIIFALSILIGIFLLRIAIKNWRRHLDISAAAFVIVIGALGNLYDRAVYEFTVDYIFIFNRLAINLSDLVILSGVITFLISSRRHRSHEKTHPDEPKR